MRVFYYGVVVVWIVLLALTGGAVLASRRPIVPDRVARWRLADCAPSCWMGIRPGETSLIDARQRIASLASDSAYHLDEISSDAERGAELQVIDPADPESRIKVLLYAEGRVVGTTYQTGVVYDVSVRANYGNDHMPTLAEVFSALGAPGQVQIDPTGPTTLVYTDSMCETVLVITTSGTFQEGWNRPIQSFRVADSLSPAFVGQDICDRSGAGSGWLDYWTGAPFQP